MDAVTSGGSEIRANDPTPVNFVAVCRRLLNTLATCFCGLTWHRKSSDFCPMRDSDHAECEGVSVRYKDSDVELSLQLLEPLTQHIDRSLAKKLVVRF